MDANENKELMRTVFDELARGNGQPLVDSLAEDCRWTVMGSTAWSGTYDGRRAIRSRLLGQLAAQFADVYTNTAHRFVAEGEYVVVESQGRVTTTRGEPYHNRYCFVCRIVDGRLREIVEYSDTQLIATALATPAR